MRYYLAFAVESTALEIRIIHIIIVLQAVQEIITIRCWIVADTIVRRVAVEIIAALDVQLATTVDVIPATTDEITILIDFGVVLLV